VPGEFWGDGRHTAMAEIRRDYAEETSGLPRQGESEIAPVTSRSLFADARRAAASRSYPWIVAPVLAALIVAWGAAIPLDSAGPVHEGLAVAALYIGCAVLAVTPGVAVLSVFSRATRLGPATALGLLLAGSATVAMAGFWAWFVNPLFGRGIDLGLLIASVGLIAVFGRRGDMRSYGLSVPLLLGLALGLAFTGLAFVQGQGVAVNAVHTISTRYWRAADNAIPLLFAMRVAAHTPLSGSLVGDWLSSDRPPLQTGFTLLQWPLFGSRGTIQVEAAYQLLASGLSVSWVPTLWVVFRVRGIATGRIAVAVMVTALTGFVFVSTLYVWPKLLAGSLALSALAIVVTQDEADGKKGTGVLALALLTLSMLAHGGTAFAVIALLPFAWRLRRRINLRAVAASAGVLGALYVPWTLYQQFVDPPGDRLLKWQLAGQSIVTSDSFFQTLVHNYNQLTFADLLDNKWENLASLVVNPVMARTQGAEPAWASGFLGFARIAQVNDLLPATGLLLLGVIALLIPSSRRKLAALKPLAVFTGIALVAWVILLWGGEAVAAINHQGAYAVTVLFIGMCALAVTALPWFAMVLVVAGSMAWFAVSWIPGLGFIPAVRHFAPHGSAPWSQTMLTIRAAGKFNPAMLGVSLAGVVIVIAALAWLSFGPRWRTKTVAFSAPPAASSPTAAYGWRRAR